jgi:hypothetical protein
MDERIGEHIAKALRDGWAVERSVAHAHSRHLHSLVLVAGPPMVRLYFAAEGHDLWRNKPTIGRGRCTFEEPMSVAIHGHRQDITVLPLFGEVTNVLFAYAADASAGMPRCSLQTFEYRSAILDGQGAFSLVGPVELGLVGLGYGEMFLRGCDMHTVYVPKGQRAAWIIEEGTTDLDYEARCHSNADLAMFDFAGLYQPMPEAMGRSILDACVVELGLDRSGS